MRNALDQVGIFGSAFPASRLIFIRTNFLQEVGAGRVRHIDRRLSRYGVFGRHPTDIEEANAKPASFKTLADQIKTRLAGKRLIKPLEVSVSGHAPLLVVGKCCLNLLPHLAGVAGTVTGWQMWNVAALLRTTESW